MFKNDFRITSMQKCKWSKIFFFEYVFFFVFEIENAHFDRKLNEIIIVLNENDMYQITQNFNQTSQKTSILFNVNINHRCDVSFWSIFDIDKSQFFLDRIYQINETDKMITTFFVKKIMFKNFFKILNFDEFEMFEIEKKSFTISIAKFIQILFVSKIDNNISFNFMNRMFAIFSIFNFIENVDIEHIVSRKSTNLFISKKTILTFTFVIVAILQRSNLNKSNEKFKIQFRKSIRSNVCTIRENSDIFKIRILNLYNEFKNKKNDNVLYVLRKNNNIDEHFSFYRCRFQNIVKLFDILDTENSIFSCLLNKKIDMKRLNKNQTNSKK